MAKRAHKSNRTDKRRAVAGGAHEALPALSSLSELPAYTELTASDRQRTAFEQEVERIVNAGEARREELDLGCVVRLDRGFPAVITPRGVYRTEFAASLTKGDDNSRAAVGDWVCARRPEGHDMGILCKILPRESDIARWKGGSRGERQTLAANVDTVLVTQALGPNPISVDRVVRSAVIARDCGADIAVVLTKADRAGASMLQTDVTLIQEVLGQEVRIVATSAGASRRRAAADLRDAANRCGSGWGEDDVRGIVPAGTVAIVLGESGAGKSTLLNALLGREALETGAVRMSDDMGRHTTVARRMVSLPGAGVIVDEPGLRSLPLVGHERGLAKVFPEIAEAAWSCRFRDCTHTHEPGCGVRSAFAEGKFSKERLDAYVSLASEMRASAKTLDPDVVL